MNNYEFEYMMLDRLRTDCDNFLGCGNRNAKILWAKSVDDQIAEMKRLWNSLPVKPEWLSMEDILSVEKQMNSHDEKKDGTLNHFIEPKKEVVMENTMAASAENISEQELKEIYGEVRYGK